MLSYIFIYLLGFESIPKQMIGIQFVCPIFTTRHCTNTTATSTYRRCPSSSFRCTSIAIRRCVSRPAPDRWCCGRSSPMTLWPVCRWCPAQSDCRWRWVHSVFAFGSPGFIEHTRLVSRPWSRSCGTSRRWTESQECCTIWRRNRRAQPNGNRSNAHERCDVGACGGKGRRSSWNTVHAIYNIYRGRR